MRTKPFRRPCIVLMLLLALLFSAGAWPGQAVLAGNGPAVKTAPVAPALAGVGTSGAGTSDSPLMLHLTGVSDDWARLQIWASGPDVSANWFFLGSCLADMTGHWSWSGPLPGPGLYRIRAGMHDERGVWGGWSEVWPVIVDPGRPLEYLSLQQGLAGYAGASVDMTNTWQAAGGYIGGGDEFVIRPDISSTQLTYDLSGLPTGRTVERAVLCLFVSGQSNNLPMTLVAAGVSSNSGVSTQGLVAGQAMVSLVGKNHWVAVDVTSFFAGSLGGLSEAHVALLGTSLGAVEYRFCSNTWWETGRRPMLVLTLAPA